MIPLVFRGAGCPLRGSRSALRVRLELPPFHSANRSPSPALQPSPE